MGRSGITQEDSIERIKRLTIIALFSDDEFVERFVLKGGNALTFAYGLNMRVSADLDLSMASAFDKSELDDVRDRVARRLEQTFKPEGWVSFDVNFAEKPKELSEDLAAFWGGYSLDFKLIDIARHAQCHGNLQEMRKYAQLTGPGQRKRFQVDISCHEKCEHKVEINLDGFTVYVYSPVLLVCEKLRAICQQMPEYDRVVKRYREHRTARPRDFLDLHILLNHFDQIDLTSIENRKLLVDVFAAKRVPLSYLESVRDSYGQHVTAWQSVKDTIRPGFALKEFRYYFDFVVELVEQLHPLGDV